MNNEIKKQKALKAEKFKPDFDKIEFENNLRLNQQAQMMKRIKQCVRIFKGSTDIETRINNCLVEMNENGWLLEHIVSHASNHSMWCLTFYKIEV